MKHRLLALAIVVSGCNAGDTSTYTLYRSSIDGDMRIHIATFDTKEGESYNQENCQIAASLFQSQPGVTVRYWCEKGQFRQ